MDNTIRETNSGFAKSQSSSTEIYVYAVFSTDDLYRQSDFSQHEMVVMAIAGVDAYGFALMRGIAAINFAIALEKN